MEYVLQQIRLWFYRESIPKLTINSLVHLWSQPYIPPPNVKMCLFNVRSAFLETFIHIKCSCVIHTMWFHTVEGKSDR